MFIWCQMIHFFVFLYLIGMTCIVQNKFELQKGHSFFIIIIFFSDCASALQNVLLGIRPLMSLKGH